MPAGLSAQPERIFEGGYNARYWVRHVLQVARWELFAARLLLLGARTTALDAWVMRNTRQLSRAAWQHTIVGSGHLTEISIDNVFGEEIFWADVVLGATEMVRRVYEVHRSVRDLAEFLWERDDGVMAHHDLGTSGGTNVYPGNPNPVVTDSDED